MRSTFALGAPMDRAVFYKPVMRRDAHRVIYLAGAAFTGTILYATFLLSLTRTQPRWDKP